MKDSIPMAGTLSGDNDVCVETGVVTAHDEPFPQTTTTTFTSKQRSCLLWSILTIGLMGVVAAVTAVSLLRDRTTGQATAALGKERFPFRYRDDQTGTINNNPATIGGSSGQPKTANIDVTGSANKRNGTDYTAIMEDLPVQPLPQCMVEADGLFVTALEDQPLYEEISHMTLPNGIKLTSANPEHDNNNSPTRTFDVTPYHEITDSGSVIFHVETVPVALPEHVHHPRLTYEDIWQAVHDESSRFYQNQTAPGQPLFPRPLLPNVTIEVASRLANDYAKPQNNNNATNITTTDVVYAGGQGVFVACLMAFAHHLPLALSPDHLWAVITNGVARHVDHFPEQLRANFVKHMEGQVEIEIREDNMVRDDSPPEKWEELIFPKFAAALQEHLQPGVHEALISPFSISTPTQQAVSQVVLMSTLKHYFHFTMVTSCGIPKIRLDGTRDDWIRLRERTARLAPLMKPNNDANEQTTNSPVDSWIEDIVLPILDEFIAAYDGNINYCFWQNMVKFRSSAGGSGAYDFISGWLHTLFPYLERNGSTYNAQVLTSLTSESTTTSRTSRATTPTTKVNPYLRHWSEAAGGAQLGPEPEEIPIQLSSVPVQWVYHEEEIPLHFHAGFRGVAQEEDGTLAPVLGWYISEDP